MLLSNAQGQAREEIKERFEARADVAARFTATYARDLLVQERRVAARELSGAAVSSGDMQGVTNLFGYEAAVLLDASGRALRLAPEKAELVGQDLTKTYDHLRAAASGRTAVSKVVPSAAEGIPIVAFATPFQSDRGRRVFSGAFDVVAVAVVDLLEVIQHCAWWPKLCATRCAPVIWSGAGVGRSFLAILPSTDIGKAERVAERVRESVSSMPVVVGDQLVPVSVSIGAAARTGDQCDALVAEADAAMYEAKASGRNAVRVAD